MTTSRESINLDDLMAYVDGQLPPPRRREVEALAARDPAVAQTLAAYTAQREQLRASLAPVAGESVPQRLLSVPRPARFRLPRIAAMVATLAVGALTGSLATLRFITPEAPVTTAFEAPVPVAELPRFARQAAVAHVVYSPDVRRPVEVGADQEQQLVAWLSKRLGTELKPPSLTAIGYELIGGRLLPGDQGPVAQFMYHDRIGQRLTLYVTREAPKAAGRAQTAFRFGKDGPVGVFYWVDNEFGYAISGGVDRQELTRVAQEVHRQLSPE